MAVPSPHWYIQTWTWPNREIQEVKFVDSNVSFTSTTVEVKVPSTSSAVEVSFARTGEMYSVASNSTKQFVDKAADGIFVKLGAASDSVTIMAW